MALKFPIYLDNQATTPMDPKVLDAMMLFFKDKFGNPHSTTHRYGWEAAAAIDVAREQIAAVINADPADILFLSGATEANNLAIKGIAETFAKKSPEIITVKTEHKCVLESCLAGKRYGAKIRYIPVDKDGLVDMKAFEGMVNENTRLVTVMAVNNEIGVIQPLDEIGRICREKGVVFHSDAAQAFGKIPLDVKKMNIDMMSLSGHKIYGPKGVGVLYASKKVRRKLTPQMDGGGQEKRIRSGTLAPALCVGFGKAAEIAGNSMENEGRRIAAMVKKFRETLEKGCPGMKMNGSLENRLKGNLNVSFPGIDGDLLISELRKIAISSGAACASAMEGPSYVLEEIGVPADVAKSSLRIGFGRFTTEEEADFAANYITETVQKLGGCKG